MGTATSWSRILYALTLILAFALPFEAATRPVLVLPWFQFTNLEVLTGAVIVLWLLDVWWQGGMARLARVYHEDRPLAWYTLAFLGLTILSAMLAPAHRLDALKFTTRVATGVVVFWMLVDTVRTRSHLIHLLIALALGSGASALVGLGEAAAWPPLESVLALFKSAPTRVGGELRVSASFQYATIAAMYFEMTIPAAVALAALARRPALRWLALTVALLGTANTVLTFSRAGMITLLLSLTIMLLLAWRLRLRPLALPTLVAIGGLVGLTGALAWQTQTFRTRMVTENDLGWYGATYVVPSQVSLTAGQPTTVAVTVQNTGQSLWHTTGSQPFALGYYWLDDEGAALAVDHVEMPLPHQVRPGERVDVTIDVHPSLPPGDYRLVWGMLQHDILWFRHRGVPEAHTSVRIEPGTVPTSPAPARAESVPGGDMPALPPTIGRLTLWRAALRMWAERPLLGVGPDNFRHIYGRYLGLPDWDRGLHSNNLYLELLAGWGLAGALAFGALTWSILSRWYRLWQAPAPMALASVALGASFLAFYVHGTLDCFFGFASLNFLFWMIAALLVAAGRLASPPGPAGTADPPA